MISSGASEKTIFSRQNHEKMEVHRGAKGHSLEQANRLLEKSDKGELSQFWKRLNGSLLERTRKLPVWGARQNTRNKTRTQ